MVQNSEMKQISKVNYVGEEINCNGKNYINIEERWKKGLRIITQTMGLVKEISLGNHIFEIGLLFGDLNIVNGSMLIHL